MISDKYVTCICVLAANITLTKGKFETKPYINSSGQCGIKCKFVYDVLVVTHV